MFPICDALPFQRNATSCYRWRPGDRIQIVKASESALGAIIGRSRNESTAKLARRIWLAILMKHLKVNPKQRRRAKPLIDFDVPLRRKFPISQPSILKRLGAYNKTRSYDYRVKPFGFVQTVTPRRSAERPIDVCRLRRLKADLAKSKRLAMGRFQYRRSHSIGLAWQPHGRYAAGHAA